MAMGSGWFKNQLTSAKKDADMWAGLADAIQSLVADVVDPYLKRISDRKSIFTMSNTDLETSINELGEFFTILASDASSEQMLLLQRKDEIHFKGTSRPITQTFYREFNGVPITWQPLYAPVDTVSYAYGTVLIPGDQLATVSNNYGDLFLTSRGVISIGLNDLLDLIATGTATGDTQEEITEAALTKFKQVVKPLLPCHIVFDGLSLYLKVSLAEVLKEAVVYRSVSVGVEFDTAIIDDRADMTITATEPQHEADPPAYKGDIFNRFDDVIFDTLVFDYVHVPKVNRYDEVRSDCALSDQVVIQLPIVSLDDDRLTIASDLSTITIPLMGCYGLIVTRSNGSSISYTRTDSTDAITITYDVTIKKIEFFV